MKEKKEELWQIMLDMTFDDKATYEKVMNAVNEANGKHGFISSIGNGKVKGLHIEDDKKETIRPQKGEIWTYLNEDGDPEALFRSNGKCSTDENGDLIFDADKSIEMSDNIMKPFLIITGEDQQFPGETCRKATKQEVKCFYTLVINAEEKEAKKEKKWSVGDWVYTVGSETGCCRVFYPVPVTYAETKTMENLFRRGWVFDKEEECEAICNKLNDAIKDVKP